jgi:U3 small nucleolar RNA-associated protein 21
MLIHEFKSTSLRPSMVSQQKTTSPITSLVQSPAVDVVGIGFASGEVSIYDIRTDERLLSVNMGASMGSGGDAGHITAIGFRAGTKCSPLAT